ncbi:MAG: FAD-dependent thymidylate synthase [Mycoplasmataceae bacterium]|nr:FAD-dependent thymidylate synthase [Mycoplasmataceae bacterium]
MKLTKEQAQEIKDQQLQENKTKRVTAPELETILYEAIPVLDHGFIRVVDYMGDDSSIVQAARVSYGKGTKKVSTDAGLIKYLMRHWHSTPFEMCEIKYHVKLPIFIARQWIRHRTARLNEISGRYSIMPNDFYLPDEKDIAFQSDDNKQGRSTDTVPPEIIKKVLNALDSEQKNIYKNYEQLIADGVARELARVNLPLSLYTEWYWQIDLHNLFHFLRLRLDSHAQKEIRDYADVMLDIASKVAPLACEAFILYLKDGKQFSKSEIENINALLDGNKITLEGREKEIFMEKLGRINR